jgi:hypothetical protein
MEMAKMNLASMSVDALLKRLIITTSREFIAR